MKLINYDAKDLIMQNVRTPKKETPSTITKPQYDILCRLIRQKHIEKLFFERVLKSLFEVTNWKQLTYSQMYELIYVLTTKELRCNIDFFKEST